MSAKSVARLRALSEQVRIKLLPPNSTERFRKQLAQEARKELTGVIARDKPSSYRVIVDGTDYGQDPNAEDHVRADGRITYVFSYLPEIIDEILVALRNASPEHKSPTKVRGTLPDNVRYKDHHIVLQDGNVVTDLTKLRDDQEIWITNLLRYARKIEINYKNYYMMSGPYDKAAAMAKRRFGNMLGIKLTWMHYQDLHAADPNGPQKDRLSKPRDRSNNIRYPTLVLTPL